MEEKRTRRSKGQVFLLISNLLLMAVAAALAIALAVTWMSGKHTKQQAEADALEKEQQIMEVMAELDQKELTNQELEAFMAHLYETADSFPPGTEFMQRLFPDKLVYRHEGKYVFEDIDPSFPLSHYDWDGFEKEDGVITYTAPDGSKGMKGIDVSKYQGYINWDQVAADGVEFAMIRAGYRGYSTGELVEDEYFRTNLSGAINAGLKVGVYFFSQATTPEEGAEEADFVLDRIEGYDVTFPVVIDTEAAADEGRTDELTPLERANAVKAFYDRVEERGYKSLVYTSVTWLETALDPETLMDCDKWIAAYWTAPLYPYQFSMWQYSATGRVAGVSGDVDLNIGFFDYEEDAEE